MTAGKRSPDGQFREPFYNREIAKRVVADLVDRGYDAEVLLPEDDDISFPSFMTINIQPYPVFRPIS